MAVFWLAVVGESLGPRRLAVLARLRLLGNRPLRVEGLQHLSHAGVYTLAVNHSGGRRALDIIAAVLLAANRRRPDLANQYGLIVGERRAGPRARPPQARLFRRLLHLLYRRWARHVVRIPLGNDRASIASLRRWRACAGRQPCLVFPEGQGRAEFGAIRPGAGRWLASLDTPTLPVGAWYQGAGWHVRFGAPIVWCRRAELRDVQLGLAIATLLPPDLAPAWAPHLVFWQKAHTTDEPATAGPAV